MQHLIRFAVTIFFNILQRGDVIRAIYIKTTKRNAEVLRKPMHQCFWFADLRILVSTFRNCYANAADHMTKSDLKSKSKIAAVIRHCETFGHLPNQGQILAWFCWYQTYLYPRPRKLEAGILDSPCPSVRPSVCLQTTWFPENKSSLLWNFNFKFHIHVDGGHRQEPIDILWRHFQNGRLAAILHFLVSRL